MNGGGTPNRQSELATRIGVALVLISLAGAALWAGGMLFWLLVVVIGLLMMSEWADLAGATARHKRLGQYALSVPLAAMAPVAAGSGFFALGLIAGAAFFTAAVLRNGRMGWGVAYIGFPVLALVLLRSEPDGVLLAFWAIALVSACDTGAYFAGRMIGGPKLAPAISPNKTWAGLVGGIAAAVLLAIALRHFFGLERELVAATPVLAILAQAGDLYESHLKRRAGVKDSGTLLPGHGGLLDRLDGLVAVAPAAALCVVVPRAFG